MSLKNLDPNALSIINAANLIISGVPITYAANGLDINAVEAMVKTLKEQKKARRRRWEAHTRTRRIHLLAFGRLLPYAEESRITKITRR